MRRRPCYGSDLSCSSICGGNHAIQSRAAPQFPVHCTQVCASIIERRAAYVLNSDVGGAPVLEAQRLRAFFSTHR